MIDAPCCASGVHAEGPGSNPMGAKGSTSTSYLPKLNILIQRRKESKARLNPGSYVFTSGNPAQSSRHFSWVKRHTTHYTRAANETRYFEKPIYL